MRNTHAIVLVICAAAACALVAGCGTATSAPTPTASAAGDLSAELSINPDPPVPMREAELEFTLHDAGGQPVEGAIVTLDLTMPAMRMPVNRPVVADKGNGVYSATALFTMAGEWQVQAVVNSAGERHEFVFRFRTR